MLAATRFSFKRLVAGLTVLGLLWWTGAPVPSQAAQIVAGSIHPKQIDNSESSSFGPLAENLRRLAEERLAWWAPGCSKNRTVQVKILAINDFHGQIGAGKTVSGRKVGSAPILAAYLKAAQKGWEGRTIIAEDGDLMGASPPDSALLQDEPSIMFMNLLGNRALNLKQRLFKPALQAKLGVNPDFWNPLSNLVGVVGNHEFDKGKDELLRRLYGGNFVAPDGSNLESGPFLEDPWKGADYPTLAANVISKDTKKYILPPYVIKKVNGMPIGFIGAVLKETPTMVTPTGVALLDFTDEADAINKQVKELKRKNVHAIVVLLHQGAYQTSYNGATDPTKNTLTSADPLLNILERLDGDVDVVVSGHSHSFTNALVKNSKGATFLVTQAYSAGTAYADIQLGIDLKTKDVVSKSAAILTTWADEGPGLTPDSKAQNLMDAADAKVAPITEQVVGTAATDITRVQSAAGESALGNLIADSQRAAMGTDFAFMNPGGIRDDIHSGEVTRGDLYTIQPFNNYLVKIELTGQQIYDVLEQQFEGPNQPYTKMLQISGLTYTWNSSQPLGSRITEVRKAGSPIDKNATYTVTVNNFLQGGGDNFRVFASGTNAVVGPVDLEAFVSYVVNLTQPFTASIEGRISLQTTP
jgi:5'-nucleotidase